MASDLATHGILPNKTGSTKPAQVAPELAQHYWRGVMDGDGWIAKNQEALTLCGDYDLVMSFQMFVLSHCPEVRAKVTKAENIFKFSVGRPGTKCMLQILYGNATIFLERKYDLARGSIDA